MAELPDARDGLTRLERVILWQLGETQREVFPAGRSESGPLHSGRDSVPTALLYGRVVEHLSVSVDEFQRVLQRLVGSRY